MTKEQFKRYAGNAILVATAIAATWGVMTIRELRADIATYEERLEELRVQKVILDSIEAHLTEQNEVLGK